MSSYEQLAGDALRAHRETVLLRLLIRVSQIETNELTDRLRAHGYVDVQTAHIRLLGNVDTEGTRIVTVAERLGTTRQAASQLVQAIERLGYLERAADPEDGRGVLVRHTAAGRKLLATALADMADIEAGYESLLGVARMRALKRALADIAAATGPDTGLGR